MKSNKLEFKMLILNIKILRKLYFENINLEFEKGSHTIITGENGSGKSTLLGLNAGIFYPQQGSVTSFSNKYGYVSAQPYIFKDTL